MADGDLKRVPWQPITELGTTERLVNGELAGVDALRREWQRFLDGLDESDRVEIRRRTLRRLAIETGIIERIYDVDWGLTLTLVAEGLTRDVIERANGRMDQATLETIRAQRDSLEMVIDFVHQDRRLGPGFIKELHAALTRTQKTYEATDLLGRPCDVALVHGAWKTQPNHVKRPDGLLLEYAPPEHVQSEIDRLVEMYDALEATQTHPLIKAAWLHHRFVQIHPFADGNGRVARALVLLVLERHRYAPLVVDRFHRDEYLKALDRANDGDLRALVRLFARLESSALAGELERPEALVETGASTTVARTLAAQLDAWRRKRDAAVEAQIKTRSTEVQAWTQHWFESKEKELRSILPADVKTLCDAAAFGSDRSHWFRRQVIQSARDAGHFANLDGPVAWTRLTFRVKGMQLRFVASIHPVGREGGVMAVTTFGELMPFRELTRQDLVAEASSGDAEQVSTRDAFRFVHSETHEAFTRRRPELEEMLDEGLSVALARLIKEV